MMAISLIGRIGNYCLPRNLCEYFSTQFEFLSRVGRPLRKVSNRSGAQIDNPRAQMRPAVPSDASSIAAVLRRSFSEYRSKYTLEAFRATTPGREQILERMNEGPIWVAIRKDEIVGSVSVVPQGETLYIRSMAVLPAARVQGIGRQLLTEVQNFALIHGFTRLILSTTPFLESAIRLYEGFGFHRSNDGPDNLYGTPLFSMAKILIMESGSQP
jgi:ribosomal protein S18 acetylase RimI-like enzyme